MNDQDPGAAPGAAQPPTLADAVLAQARRRPAATAVIDGERALDYAELDRRSLAVARGLRAHGVRPGQAVAVRLPRSWQLVCVMLGIRRAGATVVPLDAQSPAGRRRHILDDSGARVLVLDTDTEDPEVPAAVRHLHAADLLGTTGAGSSAEPAEDAGGGDRRADRRGDEPTTGTRTGTGPVSGGDDPVAFLFYTSGTTGRPKGVEVRDAGVLRLARPGPIRLAEDARCASLSNPAFDALSFEVWVPLLSGATCVILDDAQARDPHLLADGLRRSRIDAVFVTTALFNAVVDKVPTCFDSVGRVLVGGEQLNAVRIRQWYRDNPDAPTRLVNVYGPTECTTFALAHPIPRDFDGDVVPVGRPLPATGALLAVDGSRPAETGEVGELLLSGEGLAIGYRSLPEETARRFVRLPWHDGGRELWYRTGDLVRRDTSDDITYVGRTDRQVKVRGFRIEPGEVERQLTAHPAVRQAHVCTLRDVDGAHELLAYLVLGRAWTFEEYDRHLAAVLPAYMRPHRTHLVDALPRNHNGKIDEAALLNSPAEPWRRVRTDDPEVTEDQRQLLELAGNMLGMSGLRPDDRWIPNGGDSLKALRLCFEIRDRWHVDLPQSLVLQADFAALSDAIAAGGERSLPLPPPVAAPSGLRTAPATSEQQRLWLLHRRDPHSRAYDVPLAFRLEGPVDEDALRAALRRLVERHPALRTSFRAAPDGLLQEIGDPYDPWQPTAGLRTPTVPAAPDRSAVRALPDPLTLSDAPRPSDASVAPALSDAPHLSDAPAEPALSDAPRLSDAPAEPEAPAEPVASAVPTVVEAATAATEAASGRPAETGWREAARHFFAPPFDLGTPRMLRAALVQDTEGSVLLLHLHHIAVDGWSLSTLFRDLSADCGGPADGAGDTRSEGSTAVTPAAATPVTPVDFALWQRDWHAGPAYRHQRDALRRHYAALEAPSPVRPTEAGAPRARLLRTSLDLVRRSRLDRLGADLGLTRFQLLLAAYSWSLYGVTGATRPLVAAPVAGRPRAEFGPTVGMFANTVLLPTELAPGRPLREQLAAQAAGAQEVLRRQDVALSDVLTDHRFGGDGPPFDFMFVLENTDFDALSLPGCRVRPLWVEAAEAKCALTLSVVEREDGFDCLWEYAEERIDAERVAAAARLFRRAVDLLAEDRADTLTDLVAPYRRALPEPGRGAGTTPAFTTVAEGFARQVRRTPDAPAVTSGDRTLTYAELDARAAALATELLRGHPLPADPRTPARIALHLPPSAEHVVALLAAARLNLTVVPLDPAYPPVLLREVLRQIDPVCVLVPPGGDGNLAAIASPDLHRHPVDLAALDPSAAPTGPGPTPHQGLRPLYTLFTSGSTGTPKGVDVPDRTLCNLLHWQSGAGGLPGAAVTQQFSMLSFDVSFQEIFTTLCSGGRLQLVRPEWRQDLPALLDQLESAGVERLFLPCVALQLLAEHAVHSGRFPSRLREVIAAGEQLMCTDAVRVWFTGMPGARLFNHYGPTETHVVSALCLDGDPSGWPSRPAVGRPVDNAVLRVVDESGEPVPPGATGDLLIGGAMAAPCYLGDNDLNRTRFVELPGAGTFYRSGDHAHFDGDGLLHYDGRADDQIKLSGHRLELGQVEAALLSHPAVLGALVVQDGEGLVALLQCRGDDDPDPAELTRHLAGLLPPHVRVRDFRRVDALPRTPSGKLDRRTAPATGRELRATAAAPERATEREARLCALFLRVTGKAVAPDQRFFDAGASSLDLMRFHLRCGADLGLVFTVADLFEHVTVRSLSRHLDTVNGAAPPAGPGHDTAGGPGARRVAATAAATAHGQGTTEPVAVVGMAVRLPGAPDLAAFWRMVESGGRGITYFPAAEGRVGARSQLDGPLAFDPERFGISRQEARLMDPQQRHLLMSCVEALAHAGIADPGASRTGLIAGCGENTYFQSMLREADPAELPDSFRMALHHDKDFLATKAAYHLGLTGPAFTVQAACASSLVGVHVAAGLLRQGDADVMLAGGVLVDPLLTDGYTYRPQHIFSPDGHCRPFSDDAGGTVGASGVGVVVLKTLSRARLDGDTVYAVITGSAVNNDGSEKLGYSAPSVTGQREVIRTALRRSGRAGSDVGYVEAHGTGTRLGDPVEVGALRQAFDLADSAHCALSSVKSQIGHLGAAAGVVGLVRAALSVHHGLIPPNIDFRRLNPEIGSDPTPFHVPATARAWPDGRPRVAGVSSFGIGGTNAHLILEHPDTPPSQRAPGTIPCLVLSGGSERALRADAGRVAEYLTARPETYEQVLRHLQAGRPALPYRAATVADSPRSAISWLRGLADGDAPLTPDAATAPHSHPDQRRASGPGGPPDLRPAEPSDHGLRPRNDTDHSQARETSRAWAAGETPAWPEGPAPAPWDFPPPSFDLTDHDFPRAAPASRTAPEPPRALSGTGAPDRAPEEEWLHQTTWARSRRAVPADGPPSHRVVVVVADGSTAPEDWRGLEARHTRVVHVTAASAYARVADDRYEVDPADPQALTHLLKVLTRDADDGVEWLHALPLAVRGPVDEDSLEHARHACLDAPAALCQALAGLPPHLRPRVWWLSHRAQPVTGPVDRPELALLAGAVDVPRQEIGLDTRWLDLPGGEPADWAHLLPQVLSDEPAATRPEPRLALRGGYWWRPARQPVPRPLPHGGAALARGTGTHLVLGGTGGIGASIAAWLLEHTEGRVVLLARRPHLPPALSAHAARVTLVEADLAERDRDDVLDLLAPHLGRLDGIVHAVGTAAGALLARRDGHALRHATEAKLRAALLTERLIALHRPRYAAYCSSLSAQFGGVGQFDYAAAGGVLDAFAHHDPDPSDSATVRLGIGWDVWRETGMALDSLTTDARHQEHLAVGLSSAEGLRAFADVMEAQLPHLLVSTTPLEASRYFYEPMARTGTDPATALTTPNALDELTEAVCQLLGVDSFDPETSLYDLGADSLTLLDLLSEVKRLYGVDLDLARLGHRASLNEILAQLGPPATPDTPDDPVSVEIWQQGDGADVLCLIHPVGGDIQAYRPLVSALDPHTTVCLMPDPALRDPRLPGWSVDERAARYHAALRARFPDGDTRLRLAGWSFGALVALSMAAEAETTGRTVAGLYLIDPPPAHGAARTHGYDDHDLRTVFEHELRGNGGRSPLAGAGQAYAERLAHCCRANLDAMSTHTPPRLTRTPSTLWLATHAVADLPPAPDTRSTAGEWRTLLPDGSAVHRLPASHYEIVTGPHIERVARAINDGAPARHRPGGGERHPRPSPVAPTPPPPAQPS
ncbi:amino acid adenylation domain-containing protein [Streptomyces sp. NPDC096934]|uniref:amino acid adenylation domain-containing protein n=1 Tax=Streptomyces sp. NPDC096934 TaxID=3155551 RepID=UPI00332A287E